MSRWKPCWEWEPLTSDPLSVTWDFMVDYSKSCYLFTTLMEKHPLFCPLLFLSTTAASSPSESFAPAWVQILPLSSSGRLLSLWDSLHSFSAQQTTWCPGASSLLALANSHRSLLRGSLLLLLNDLLHHKNAPAISEPWSVYPDRQPTKWLSQVSSLKTAVTGWAELSPSGCPGNYWSILGFLVPGGVVGKVKVAVGTGQAGGQGPGKPDILYCRG